MILVADKQDFPVPTLCNFAGINIAAYDVNGQVKNTLAVEGYGCVLPSSPALK
jgi:hypothetical protein